MNFIGMNFDHNNYTKPEPLEGPQVNQEVNGGSVVLSLLH